MVSNIWSNIIFEEDYRNIVALIDRLTESLFNSVNDSNYQQTLDTADNYESISIIKRELEETNDKPGYLKKLKEELENSKVELKLTLVNKQNNDFKLIIGKWIKNNLGEKVVAVIDVEPRLIGGAIISYKGNYYDGSLRSKFDDWLANIKDLVYGR